MKSKKFQNTTPHTKQVIQVLLKLSCVALCISLKLPVSHFDSQPRYENKKSRDFDAYFVHMHRVKIKIFVEIMFNKHHMGNIHA